MPCRSRGGLTTKIQAVVDARGLPVRLGLSAGQAHDTRLASTLLGNLRAGQIVLGEKTFEDDAILALGED